ncbi:hypothetical protein TCON_0478 [Astathelohania contejeani]|uniref:Uncharacterized protein n=1 Tax=Astathelohania contejeani TaxID=164912 RepID=A0ABQ7I1F7_9MICR|nr:hypothetical protein TCON_0478 [Thelohania contejeani]
MPYKLRKKNVMIKKKPNGKEKKEEIKPIVDDIEKIKNKININNINPPSPKTSSHNSCIIKIRYVSFKSLDPFFKIISTEPKFKIQIITTESLITFLNLMSYKNIKYHLAVGAAPQKEKINVIIEPEVEGSKLVLFNKKPHDDYIPLIFEVTLEEKRRYFRDVDNIDFIIKAYGKEKNLVELERIINKTELKVYPPQLSYIESIVIFGLCSASRFSVLVETLEKIDERINNSFLVQVCLNGLVSKKIVAKNGDNYRINISKESVKEICEKIGYNINKL